MNKIYKYRFVIPPAIALITLLYYSAFVYSTLYLEKEFIKPFAEQTSFLAEKPNINR